MRNGTPSASSTIFSSNGGDCSAKCSARFFSCWPRQEAGLLTRFPAVPGRAAAVTAPGLMVFAIILFMGAVSGAHLNPVVSIAFALRGDFQWRRVPGYILAQTAGAGLAAAVLRGIFGSQGDNGATVPGPGFTDPQCLPIEILLTMGLVSTILGAPPEPRTWERSLPSLWGRTSFSPVSGPARSAAHP